MYRFLLSCGHTITAVQDNEGYCPVCRQTFHVEQEWTASCEGCTFSVRTGSAQLEVQRKAGRHARRNRGHKVIIRKPDGSLYMSAYWEPGQEVMF